MAFLLRENRENGTDGQTDGRTGRNAKCGPIWRDAWQPIEQRTLLLSMLSVAATYCACSQPCQYRQCFIGLYCMYIHRRLTAIWPHIGS